MLASFSFIIYGLPFLMERSNWNYLEFVSANNSHSQIADLVSIDFRVTPLDSRVPPFHCPLYLNSIDRIPRNFALQIPHCLKNSRETVLTRRAVKSTSDSSSNPVQLLTTLSSIAAPMARPLNRSRAFSLSATGSLHHLSGVLSRGMPGRGCVCGEVR